MKKLTLIIAALFVSAMTVGAVAQPDDNATTKKTAQWTKTAVVKTDKPADLDSCKRAKVKGCGKCAKSQETGSCCAKTTGKCCRKATKTAKGDSLKVNKATKSSCCKKTTSK
jgi:hypothetical protein